MGTQHTPGPWHISPTAGRTHRTIENQNEGYGAYAIALIPEDVDSDYTPETITANARLIAASPLLLKELQHLVRLLTPLEVSGTLNVPGLATLNGARAAIAQALPPEAP